MNININYALSATKEKARNININYSLFTIHLMIWLTKKMES